MDNPQITHNHARRIAELNERFGLAGGAARFELGRGGLPCLVGRTSACELTIYLLGATLTHWAPARSTRHAVAGSPYHAPVFHLSEKSHFEDGKAIRGGVPIVFPWFGPKPNDNKAPSHGFARIWPWQPTSAGVREGGVLQAEFELPSDFVSRSFWPHEFQLRYRVTAGADLLVELEVTNRSSDTLECEALLHPYFAIGDIRRVACYIPDDSGYYDKVKREQVAAVPDPAGGFAPILIGGETDRVYQNSRKGAVLLDPLQRRRLMIGKTGSECTVLWNPWQEKGALLHDLGNDDWQRFVCIEPGMVMDHPIRLATGVSHQMEMRVGVVEV